MMSKIRHRLSIYTILISIIMCLECRLALSQNEQLADSLEHIYKNELFSKDKELMLLRNLCENLTDTDKKIAYSQNLIDKATESDSSYYVMSGLLEIGNAYRLKGDLQPALNNYFRSAQVASDQGFRKQAGAIYVAIADVYSIMENHQNSISYYRDAIAILRAEKDSVNLASALLNAGDEYFNVGKLDSALQFFQESGKIFDLFNYEIGVAYNLGNVGLVYATMGLNISAEDNINQAIDLLRNLGDYYPISVYLTYMSDIYLQKDDVRKAMDYAQRSLTIAEDHGLKEQIRDANLKLYDLNDQLGNKAAALEYFKAYVAYNDSINNIETVQEMGNMRTNYEVSQKQLEVDLLNQERKNQKIVIIGTIGIAVMILIIAIGLAHRYYFINKTKNIIQEEKNRSEKLLLNILPHETAEELKEKGRVQAKKFQSATVLFSDFTEFTRLAESIEPEHLVSSIDYYFKAFDEITTKYGLEKIKTIGDAYMCAGGIPTTSDDHAMKVVQAGWEMLQFVEQVPQTNSEILSFEVRIGIHTGPVVAGIVGNKKWQYDIWGDTVNIASRMETMSDAGKINISETTYRQIKEHLHCTYRGEIEVKNRGPLKMYFLESVKPAVRQI
jgi:adenylate cyclase